LIESFLILYGCVFKIFLFFFRLSLAPSSLKSLVRQVYMMPQVESILFAAAAIRWHNREVQEFNFVWQRGNWSWNSPL